ncbi:hypothetical protein SNEBB_003831 [Seison nebaliae]|nr:hypothetical protein SNEBB_003831 [Seison nebaliae]
MDIDADVIISSNSEIIECNDQQFNSSSFSHKVIKLVREIGKNMVDDYEGLQFRIYGRHIILNIGTMNGNIYIKNIPLSPNKN